MKNYLKTLLGALTITAFTVSSAYSGMGVSLMMGQVETDGTETERTVSGVTSEKNSASKSETYIGGSIFVEGECMDLLHLGLDVVPFKIFLVMEKEQILHLMQTKLRKKMVLLKRKQILIT